MLPSEDGMEWNMEIKSKLVTVVLFFGKVDISEFWHGRIDFVVKFFPDSDDILNSC